MFLKKIKVVAVAGCSPMLFPAAALYGQGANLTSEGPIVYDHDTKETRATGHARLSYNDSLLTANEIVFNNETRSAVARGNVTVTHPEVRIVGDSIHYRIDSQTATGHDIRFGQPPFFAEAEEINASRDQVEFDETTAYFGEPRPGAINLHASSISYVPDERIEARNVTLRVGKVPFFYLPKLGRRLDGALLIRAETEAGYTDNLGAFGFLGLRVPVMPGFFAGPEMGYYQQRGLLIGPGLDYSFSTDRHTIRGGFRGGFIDDHGDTDDLGVDRVGEPIDHQRYYGEWRHRQTVGEFLEITAVSDIWSDSEVTRDFRESLFNQNQFPNNFFEADYLGENYLVSAFTRISPNDFEIVPERLPEIRFDLFPQQIGSNDIGIYHQLQASGAVLREDNPFGEDTRSDRLDLYYGLNRPFRLTDWLTFTPKAGARVTHYERALDNRDNYTRVLGEIGADIEAEAFAVYEYDNALWQIDDIRHVIEPRIHYRYIPGADSGRRFIPRIDRDVFSTYLEPLDLGHTRNLDELDEIHTLRYGIQNSFQTRDPVYGSRDLLSIFIANDLRFSREPGEELVSDVHAELLFSPIYWLRLDALTRVSPQQPEMRESTTGLTITDSRFWSLRLGTEYVRDRIEEYSLFYTRRLNETFSVAAELRYDAALHRFSRQTYTLFQNFYNTWEVRYQVALRSGSERESPTSFSVAFSYLSF